MNWDREQMQGIRLPLIPEQKKVVLCFGKCASTSIRKGLRARYYRDKGGSVLSCWQDLAQPLRWARCDDWEFGVVTRHPLKRFGAARRQLKHEPDDVREFLEAHYDDYHVEPISVTLERLGYDQFDLRVLSIDRPEELRRWMGFDLPRDNVGVRGVSRALPPRDERFVRRFYEDDFSMGGYE